jgi:hypothetical protein
MREGDLRMSDDAPPPVQEKRSPGLGMPAALYLQDFGQVVLEAFGEIPYHVGSSLVSNGRPSWRDVDVRLILSDERYAADGYGHPDRPHDSAKWVAMVKAFSLLGRQMTGLPIDFQIQQQTFANEKFGRVTGDHRSALFSLARSHSANEMYASGRASTEAKENE